MYKILSKEELNSTVTKMVIEAPFVAKKAEPGQFIILRVDKDGERVPLTIADFNREKETVTIIFQVVGAETTRLNKKNAGDYIEDFVGPLGNPTKTEGYKKGGRCWRRRRHGNRLSGCKKIRGMRRNGSFDSRLQK